MFSAKEIRSSIKNAYFSAIPYRSTEYYKDLHKLLKRVDLEMKEWTKLHKQQKEVGQLVKPIHGPTEPLERIACHDSRTITSYIH